MATYNIEPVSFVGPTARERSLKISFRAPNTVEGNSNPIHPATALQLSFRNDDNEVFIDRLTPRDISVDDDLCWLHIDNDTVPQFKHRPAAPAQEDFDVVLHAWRGEKLLGSWVVGRIPWHILGVE